MSYTQYTNAITRVAVAAAIAISPVATAAAQGNRTVTLDAGTVIPVKLRDPLSSTDSHKGDRFTATLESEDAARSLRLPVGTFIEGTVSAVRSMQGQDPGVISLNFDRVVLPNESSYPIHGSLIGLDDKSVTKSSNGRLVAKSDHKNKTLLYAGYGAGAGLVLGAITKGNTVLDLLLGGGLGYVLGNLDKNHGAPRDVVLKPNTELGVRLDRSINVTAYDDGTGNGNNTSAPYRPGNTSRYNVPNASDPNRDPYDDQTNGNGSQTSLDTAQALSEYTDVRDNGQPIHVVVSGHELSFLSRARPFISGGVVMVPVIPVLKAEHERYSYTASQFTANGPDESFTGRFDSRTVTGSGNHRFTLPAAIQRRNGTVYVPMQFLSLATGQRLNFDRDSQTIDVDNSNSNSSRP